MVADIIYSAPPSSPPHHHKTIMEEIKKYITSTKHEF